MEQQISFADLEYGRKKKRTKREKFLTYMDEITPWDEIVERIKPYYYKDGKGRKPRGIETMFRMYLLQTWFRLSDNALEDAVYDSYAMRQFMHLDFMRQSVPDATTLRRFRKIVEKSGVAQEYFTALSAFLKDQGMILHRGVITEAALPSAPNAKKNARRKRGAQVALPPQDGADTQA